MLRDRLHPNHRTHPSLDFTKDRRKHTAPGADHPLRCAVAEAVDAQKRSIAVPERESCPWIGDVTGPMPSAHRTRTPTWHKAIDVLLRNESELDVPAMTATSEFVHRKASFRETYVRTQAVVPGQTSIQSNDNSVRTMLSRGGVSSGASGLEEARVSGVACASISRRVEALQKHGMPEK